MAALMEELALVEEGVVVDGEPPVPDAPELRRAVLEVKNANREAATVESESFQAFLELVSGADADYIDAPSPSPRLPDPLLDWDEVCLALTEAQELLAATQRLLSEILAAAGVEDHDCVRIYEDRDGRLRLVADHPRQDEIESLVNSPRHRQLKELYRAAAAGMSLAGSLVGMGALPDEVRRRVDGGGSAA